MLDSYTQQLVMIRISVKIKNTATGSFLNYLCDGISCRTDVLESRNRCMRLSDNQLPFHNGNLRTMLSWLPV